MTIEEEILKAIYEADRISNKPWSHEQSAKIAAEVAERHVVEAFEAGENHMSQFHPGFTRLKKYPNQEEYLKSKGIE